MIKENDAYNLFLLLKNSKKPLIIAGGGVRLSNSYDDFNWWLKRMEIPALTGVHSAIDCIDNNYEYYCGRIGILGQITSNKIVQEADLLIILGSRLNVKMTGYNVDAFAPNAKKVIVDIDLNEIKKHKFKVDLSINVDLHYFFDKVLKHVFDFQGLKLNIEDWKLKVKELREKQQYYYPKHKDLKNYVSLYYFMDKFKDYNKGYPIITSDGSAHVVTLQTIQLKSGQRCFTNVGCASMGYGLPAAIGACIANGKKDVICVEGDGSLQMNIQELQTLVHYKLPVKLFVVNNDGYLSIKITQSTFFNNNEVASGPKSGISFPSLEKLSKAYGIPYFNIKNNSQIGSILNVVMNIEGPVICELFCHPYEKHEPKVTSTVDKDGKIIPGTLTDMYISDEFNL